MLAKVQSSRADSSMMCAAQHLFCAAPGSASPTCCDISNCCIRCAAGKCVHVGVQWEV